MEPEHGDDVHEDHDNEDDSGEEDDVADLAAPAPAVAPAAPRGRGGGRGRGRGRGRGVAFPGGMLPGMIGGGFMGRGGRGGAVVAPAGYGVVRASKVIYNEPTVPKREHDSASEAPSPAPAGAAEAAMKRLKIRGAPASQSSHHAVVLNNIPSLGEMCRVCINKHLHVTHILQGVSRLPADIVQQLLKQLMQAKQLTRTTMKPYCSLSLTEMSLDNYAVATNDLLGAVCTNRNLVRLSCTGCSDLTDAGIAALAGVPHLTDLSLARCRLTDAGVGVLKTLTALRSLNLSDTKITSKGFAIVGAHLPLLHELHLAGTAVNSSILPLVFDKTNLVALSLSGTRINDAGLVGISSLSHLRTLHLASTAVTNKSMFHLSPLTALTALNISTTGINSLGFVHLRHLTNLTNIGWPPKQSIHNQGIEYLANLTKLAVLDFSDCINLADEGAIHLSHLTQLSFLSLANTKITDETLIRCVAKLINVRELHLDRLKSIHTEGVAHLTTLSRLVTLNLSATGIVDDTLPLFARFLCLRTLSLSRNPQLLSEGMNLYATSLQSLHLLDLTGTSVEATCDGMKLLAPLVKVRLTAPRQEFADPLL